MNRAQADRLAAEAALQAAPRAGGQVSALEVRELVARLGDVAAALQDADPADSAALYAELRLGLRYDPAAGAVDVTLAPSGRGDKLGVRGGT